MVTVSLNGVKLTAVSQAIILQEVTESKPSMAFSAVSNATGIGQRITQQERRYVDVVVRFSINLLKNNEQSRATVLNAVNKWATAGGRLEVSYRSGVHMDVVCVDQLQVGNIKKWNADYSLTFRAYIVPYWVSNTANSVNVQNSTGGTATINVGGNAKTPLHVYATNVSGATLTTVTVYANSQTIACTGMSIAPGQAFDIDYENGIMTIEGAGQHIAGCRVPSSSDDIWLYAGGNAIAYSSNVACRWQLYTYERWL